MTLLHVCVINFSYQMTITKESHVLIATNRKHCIELVYPSPPQIETYIGEYETSGSVYNGHRTQTVLLNRPLGIAANTYSSIFIGLFSEHKIVHMELTGDSVASDVFSTSPYAPIYLKFDSEILYMTVTHGFGTYNFDTRNVDLLVGSTGSGNTIGDVNATEYNFPCSFAKLDDKAWFITDMNNRR